MPFGSRRPIADEPRGSSRCVKERAIPMVTPVSPDPRSTPARAPESNLTELIQAEEYSGSVANMISVRVYVYYFMLINF